VESLDISLEELNAAVVSRRLHTVVSSSLCLERFPTKFPNYTLVGPLHLALALLLSLIREGFSLSSTALR
jgi:hypothetical protein